MAARLIEYQSGLDEALAAPAMYEAIEARVKVARAYAIRISPERTGNYKRQFKIIRGVRNGHALVRLINDAHSEDGYPYCVAIEFGRRWIDRRTGHPREIKRQRILGRTADALKL